MFAAECDERRFGTRGYDECRCELGRARAAGCTRDAGLVRRARPAVGHSESCPFVADFDELHAELVELAVPIHVRVTHDAEHGLGAFRLERLGETLIYLHACPPVLILCKWVVDLRNHRPAAKKPCAWASSAGSGNARGCGDDMTSRRERPSTRAPHARGGAETATSEVHIMVQARPQMRLHSDTRPCRRSRHAFASKA